MSGAPVMSMSSTVSARSRACGGLLDRGDEPLVGVREAESAFGVPEGAQYSRTHVCGGRLGERTLCVAGRHFRRSLRERHLRGLEQRLDHPWLAGRFCSKQMGGHTARLRSLVAQQPGRGAMCARAAAGRHRLPHRGPDYGVHEVKRPSRGEQVVLNERVEGRLGLVDGATDEAGGPAELRVVAQHCDGTGELGREVRQSRQPAQDPARDVGRADLADPRGAVGVGGDAALLERSHELAQHERISAARGVTGSAEALICAARQVPHDLRSCRRGE